MFFLFGERIHTAIDDAGRKPCGVCGTTTRFRHVTESLWFCIFGLRLLPIEKVADYFECPDCRQAFTRNTDVPTQVTVVQRVVTYLLLGYGMHEHREVAQEICRKITGYEFGDEELRSIMRDLDAGKEDMLDIIRLASSSLNARGKHQVLQAAFLMTHVCCEIQHADRVRINMMGTAMGTSIQFVNAAIETVRDQNYFGVRRILPTQAV